MAKKRPQKLTNQLRQAIEDVGLSRYAISQETGIDQAASLVSCVGKWA